MRRKPDGDPEGQMPPKRSRLPFRRFLNLGSDSSSGGAPRSKRPKLPDCELSLMPAPLEAPWVWQLPPDSDDLQTKAMVGGFQLCIKNVNNLGTFYFEIHSVKFMEGDRMCEVKIPSLYVYRNPGNPGVDFFLQADRQPNYLKKIFDVEGFLRQVSTLILSNTESKNASVELILDQVGSYIGENKCCFDEFGRSVEITEANDRAERLRKKLAKSVGKNKSFYMKESVDIDIKPTVDGVFCAATSGINVDTSQVNHRVIRFVHRVFHDPSRSSSNSGSTSDAGADLRTPPRTP